MRFKIANRIEEMLCEDKFADPQRVCEVLKDELQPIASNYLALNDDIRVRYRKEGENNIFFIEMKAERIKPFGFIPS